MLLALLKYKSITLSGMQYSDRTVSFLVNPIIRLANISSPPSPLFSSLLPFLPLFLNYLSDDNHAITSYISFLICTFWQLHVYFCSIFVKLHYFVFLHHNYYSLLILLLLYCVPTIIILVYSIYIPSWS